MSNPQNPYDAPNPYGQPASSSSAPSYGQPSDPSPYGQPSDAPYSQPSAPSYGQPSDAPYSQPSAPSYGQSSYVQPSYEPAQPQQYGQPSAGGYAGYTAPQPYPQQYAVNPYAAVMAPEHPQGTAILVLGILGFFTGITGLIAWIMGHKAEKEMAASGITYSNASNIKIGKILGIVTTILAGVYLLFIVGYLIFIFVLLASISTTTY